jgi:hypothetical protein
MGISTVPTDPRALRTRALLAQANYRTAEGKKFQERHFLDFPEKRWQRQKGGQKGALIFFGIIGLYGFIIMFLVPGILNKLLLAGPPVALFVGIAWAVWNSRNDEIIVTADGIKGPGWKRSLRFAYVETYQIRTIQLRAGRPIVFQMKFIFKTKLKAMAKWSVRSSCKSIWLHVGTEMSEKPDTMLQTIYCYYTRQKA